MQSWLQEKDLKNWLTKNTKLNKATHIAHCKVCDYDLKVVAGKKDLLSHANSLKHRNNAKKLLKQPDIKSTFVSATGQKECVMNAELCVAAFCVEHNIAISSMDHLVKMIKHIAVGSPAIESMSLARTKTTAIINNVIGSTQSGKLYKIMNSTKFSLCIDESTDLSSTKLLSLVVRTCFENRVNIIFYDRIKYIISFKFILQIEDYFLELLKVTRADATSIYEAVINLFLEKNINYKKNLIGFAADGAAVMHGRNHSVAVLLKKDCPNLFCMKCICHSFALCTSYACKELPASVETMARDVYNYIQNSPKRIEEFTCIEKLLEIKPKKILHPSQTRWLSLEAVVKRLIELYDPLKIYFVFAVNADKLESATTILNYLEDPLNLLYLKFLSSILPIINNLNRLFQCEAPKIHKLYTEIERLVLTVLDCFMLSSYTSGQNIADIDFENPDNHCSLDELYLGAQVFAQLTETNMSEENTIKFKKHCLNFYIELVTQIYKRFDFKNKPLQLLATIGPDVVASKRTRSITELCMCFPNLIAAADLQLADNEWREIRFLDFASLFPNENFDLIDIELFWKVILNQRRADSSVAFPILKKFIFNVLVLPVSSANVERTFSTINLNKTKTRNRLECTTLSGILKTKDLMKKQNMCCNFKPDREMYQKFNVTMYSQNKD